uniref:Uncharacterized protein n=1 Tax=Oryza brachyantha TaxID=4533 RepID=J3ML39_ORYBR
MSESPERAWSLASSRHPPIGTSPPATTAKRGRRTAPSHPSTNPSLQLEPVAQGPDLQNRRVNPKPLIGDLMKTKRIPVLTLALPKDSRRSCATGRGCGRAAPLKIDGITSATPAGKPTPQAEKIEAPNKLKSVIVAKRQEQEVMFHENGRWCARNFGGGGALCRHPQPPELLRAIINRGETWLPEGGVSAAWPKIIASRIAETQSVAFTAGNQAIPPRPAGPLHSVHSRISFASKFSKRNCAYLNLPSAQEFPPLPAKANPSYKSEGTREHGEPAGPTEVPDPRSKFGYAAIPGTEVMEHELEQLRHHGVVISSSLVGHVVSPSEVA